jgi:hypothetical protein
LDVQLQDQKYVLFKPAATYLATQGEFLSAVGQAAQHLVYLGGRTWMVDRLKDKELYLRLPCTGLGVSAEYIEVSFAVDAQPNEVTFSLLPNSAEIYDLYDLFNLFRLYELLTAQLDLLLHRRTG